MIYKKTWYKRTDSGNTVYKYEGLFVLFIIPVFIKRSIVSGYY